MLEDQPEERRPVFERLLQGCEAVWAASPDEAYAVMEQHDHFDAYCLDYDLTEERGGWLPVAKAIRQWDPYSIARVVLVHSSNLDAREYLSLFPAAIVIQWDVLATILGMNLIDEKLISRVIEEVGTNGTVEEMRDTVIRLRSRASE